MKEISDFSTSVMWWNVKLIHTWRNFRFLLICLVQKVEISPHDRFFLHGHRPCVRDKYRVWTDIWQEPMGVLMQEMEPKQLLTDIGWVENSRGGLAEMWGSELGSSEIWVRGSSECRSRWSHHHQFSGLKSPLPFSSPLNCQTHNTDRYQRMVYIWTWPLFDMAMDIAMDLQQLLGRCFWPLQITLKSNFHQLSRININWHCHGWGVDWAYQVRQDQ